MTTVILVLVVLMVFVALAVALGVHRRRSRAGGVIGVQRRSGTRTGGRSG